MFESGCCVIIELPLFRVLFFKHFISDLFSVGFDC